MKAESKIEEVEDEVGDDEEQEQTEKQYAQTLVYKSPMFMRMFFLRRIFTGIFVQLAVALAITSVSMQSRVFYQTMTKNIILDVVLFVTCLVLLIVYKMGQYDHYGTLCRLLILAISTLTVTSILCFITSIFDSHVLIQSTILTSFFIFGMALYTTLQWWLDYSTFWASIFVIIRTLVCGVIFVYKPYPEFVMEPSVAWFSPPNAIKDIILILLLNCAFDLYFLYLLNDILGRVTCDEYLHATFLLIFDFSYFLLLLWGYIVFLCKRPSRNPVLNDNIGKIVETATLFT